MFGSKKRFHITAFEGAFLRLDMLLRERESSNRESTRQTRNHSKVPEAKSTSPALSHKLIYLLLGERERERERNREERLIEMLLASPE